MQRILFILCILTLSATASHKVYLIHGFASNPLVMIKLENGLKKGGFNVKNYGYNSFYTDLDTLGQNLYREIAGISEDSVSFVTHSMGALVVRSMYNYRDTTRRFPHVTRMVMLAPPNKGAEIADFFSSNALINTLLGPNLAKMRTDSNSYANSLPLPSLGETGVIIGIGSKGLWFNSKIKEETDGYLTPQRTVLGIEKDIAIVKEDHTLVTLKKHVIDLTCRFLKNGSFLDSND